MSTEPKSAADPFVAFWSDMMSRMASAGMTPQNPPPEFVNAARRAFFDAMAHYADQFMRSEAFLSAMKQSMDNALAWQQMMNQYLQRGLQTMQMPTRADADHVVLLVRGMEERLLEKLDELGKRVERIEAAQGGRTASKGARA